MKSNVDETITSLPKQNILLRWKEGIEIYQLPSNPNNEEEGKLRTLVAGHCKFHSLSKDGRKVVTYVTGKGVVVYDIGEEGGNDDIPLNGNTERVACAYFSPLGNFIATWERYNKEEDNLKVWSSSTGTLLKSWVCRSTPQHLLSQQRQQESTCGAYNVLQWTTDEKLMMFGGSNQIVAYSGGKFENVATKIRCENIRSFSISPQKLNGYLLATFIPEVKGKPGRVSLFSIYQNSDSETWQSKELIAKSFYQTEECNFHWSPLGDAMLVVTQMTVDRTGTSYYGSANVYLFTIDNAIQVTLPKSKNATVGIVHDIAWNPNVANKPPTFAMVSGPMPAMSSLHNGYTAEAIFLFGQNHRNTVVWSPHGRFLAFGGFGNLAGNLDFWDRNKGKRIPRYASATSSELMYGNSASSAPVGYGFSPSSRMFMISTTSPRMNVENGIQIFRYNGEGLQLPACLNGRYLPNKLYYAEFLPSLNTSAYPDRAQTPLPKRAPSDTNSTAAVTTTTSKPTAATGGKYVPPSMRNSSRGGALAERMRREREVNLAGPVKVTKQYSSSIPGLAPQKLVPGMAPVKTSKSRKSKNKNKQASNSDSSKPKPVTVIPKAPPQEPIQQQQDPEKRAKKIKKLIKQIDELKSSNKEFNEDQKRKIKSYDNLCAELKDLGF